MAHEQTPPIASFGPSLQGEISLSEEIARLRQHPAIGVEDLFSSKKMGSREYPDKPGVRVSLDTPIEATESSRSDVEQDLMAVVGLGEDVALGIVKGKDHSGSEVHYLSLLSSNPLGSEGRARFIDVLTEGTPITIGRSRIEEVVGRKGSAPGVSRKHCTVELKDGVLTVVDETSSNGTTAFINTTDAPTRQFARIQSWSQLSSKTEELIKASEEAKRKSRIARLGRFIVDSD